MVIDPIIREDWHPVANSQDVKLGILYASNLLGEDLVIWRGEDGIRAWRDQCPHRGSKLSLGEIRDCDKVVCPYHGWQFDSEGICVEMPAHPGRNIPARARITVFSVAEKYGLVWVCVGTPKRDILHFHGVDQDYKLVVSGPYDIETSAPRAVENFLDLAHFPFVHAGYLGEEPFTQMEEYEVDFVGEEIHINNAKAYQPRANASSDTPSKVTYSYKIIRPFSVMLTKEPSTSDLKPSDLILMVNQPINEDRTRVWFVLAMNYGFDKPDKYFQDFQDTIFLQDKAVLESQSPKLLPLELTAELHQPSDKSSVAYRKWLKSIGLSFGVQLPQEGR